jgi:hypothetical protein
MPTAIDHDTRASQSQIWQRRLLLYLLGIIVGLIALDIVIYVIFRGYVGANSGSFFLSFFASLIEDTLFFLIVGVTTFILSLRDPGREPLEVKLRYLFPTAANSSAFLNYARSEVQRVAGACRSGTQRIKVTEYSSKHNAYKIYFSCTYVIENKFDVDQYEDEFDAFVEPERFVACPEKPEPLGQVLKLEFEENGGTKVRHVDFPIDILSKDYDQKIRMVLAPRKQGELSWGFWLWCEVGREHYLRLGRFVDEFISTIENATNIPISLSLASKDNPVVVIRPGETLTLANMYHVPPRHVHVLWWHDAQSRIGKIA